MKFSTCQRLGVYLLLIPLAGCTETRYAIDVAVEGERLHRTVTITPSETNSDGLPMLDRREQAQLETIYGAAKFGTGSDVVFEGQFDGDPPSDLGGLGRHAIYHSPLGRCHVYTERIGEPIDLAGRSEQWRRGIERLIEMTGQWVRFEFGDTPSANRLAEFVQGDLANDVREISRWWLTASTTLSIGQWFQHDGNKPADAIWPTGPAIQLLVERDWIRMTDCPDLSRWMLTDDGDGFGNWLLRRIAEKAGMSDDPIFIADVLSDDEKLKASIDRFLQTTPEYADALRTWRQSDEDRQAGPPQAIAAIERLGLLEHPSMVLGGKPIDFSLQCGRRPVATNGRWEAATGRIDWSGNRDATFMPLIMSAVWVIPNDKVALPGGNIEDAKLAHFCLLYQSLTIGQREDWDRAIGNAVKTGHWSGPIDARSAEVYEKMSVLIQSAW